MDIARKPSPIPWGISLLFIILLQICTFQISHAKEPSFQTTAREIINELIREPVKYRSLVPESEKRSIVVVEKATPAPSSSSITIAGPLPHDNNDNTVHYEKKTITFIPGLDTPNSKLLIEFDTNSAALKKTSFYILKELGMALLSEELSGSNMLVAGHTDSDGSDDYNLNLSVQRADTVKQYLTINFDIPESRLKIRGYGESLPLKPNSTPDNKQINRRVEIRIIR